MSEQIGVVIIGRNESERLVRCLASVGNTYPLVYVDSGSSDDSVAEAERVGAHVVALDMSVPFSAARARNEGFARLMQLMPTTKWVQFVDGDCEMILGWMETAVEAMKSDAMVAAVCGRLRERFPEASIYNRICDLEWDKPTGVIDGCGGIAMYRVEYFRSVGGFDNSVVAGEEPELCQRLRARGWLIERLPDEMAWHDSAMHHFRQWWKRQVRGGYGAMDVSRRFEHDRNGNFTRQIRRARAWTFGYPSVLLLATIVGLLLFQWRGAVIGAVLVLFAMPLQITRLAIRQRRSGRSMDVAIAYGILTMVAKLAHVCGHFRYQRDRASRTSLRLIEYKTARAAAD